MAECTVIVPVFRNSGNINALLDRFASLNSVISGGVEVVCVVDGSPDDCYDQLHQGLPRGDYRSRLILLSRNFGSFAAIREGLRHVETPYCAVMAADLQEPQALIEEFFARLQSGAVDVVVGSRSARQDSIFERFAAGVFWGIYRRFVQPELPIGGVDVFGCNDRFRLSLIRFSESHSSLVGQIIWLGFRRESIDYVRLRRDIGKSAWTFGRKLNYLLDSVFSFSDLPIRILIALGFLGLAFASGLGVVVWLARVLGVIAVPGYTSTVLLIVLFAGINLLGLGVIGSYVWRAYENTKRRPLAVVLDSTEFRGKRR